MKTLRKKPDTEWNHIYPLPSGRHGYGATTILNVMSKPALLHWAGKVNREAVFAALHPLYDGYAETMPTDTFMRTIRDQADKPHHTLAVNAAADIGKYAHKLCEHYVAAQLGGPLVDESDGRLTFEQTSKARRAFDAFTAWAQAHQVVFLGTELRVAFEQRPDAWTGGEYIVFPAHRYGGTVDLLTERDGGHYVDDIKTSGAVYGSHGLQVLAYAKAANHSKALGFDDWQAGNVIRLPKTEKDADVEIVPAVDAIRREWPWLDLDSGWQLFLSLCDVAYATLGEPKA